MFGTGVSGGAITPKSPFENSPPATESQRAPGRVPATLSVVEVNQIEELKRQGLVDLWDCCGDRFRPESRTEVSRATRARAAIWAAAEAAEPAGPVFFVDLRISIATFDGLVTEVTRRACIRSFRGDLTFFGSQARTLAENSCKSHELTTNLLTGCKKGLTIRSGAQDILISPVAVFARCITC